MPQASPSARYAITLDPRPDGCRWQVVGGERVRAAGTAASPRLAGAESAMVAQMLAALDRTSRRRF